MEGSPPRREGARDDPAVGDGSQRTGGLGLASTPMPPTNSPLASPLREPLGNGYEDEHWMYADPPELSRRERRRGSAGESSCSLLKRQRVAVYQVLFFRDFI